MERVIAYIDGFNLYFGLREARLRRYYWLDVKRLIQNLLKPHQQLEHVHYFTSRVSSTKDDRDQSKRQGAYIESLETLSDVTLHYGHYLEKPMQCRKCGYRWISHEEKMTDVNIATEMMHDAFEDKFDSALLVSGDSDLSMPIEQIRESFPKKRIVIAFPPKRNSVHLKGVAHAYFTISRKKLKDSQLPEQISKLDGFVLSRPTTWR